MIVELLVAGGTLYAGTRVYQQLKKQGWLARRREWLHHSTSALPTPAPSSAPGPTLQKANQTLVVSSASLGLATAGWLLVMPALSLVSVPLMIYVFVPTFQAAYHSVRVERRVTNQVMDAVRITVCVVMGYDFAAALNACLQAVSQRLFVKAEADFQQHLHDLFGEKQTAIWVYHHGVEAEMLPAETPAGAVVAVTAGDTVPADGIVRYGGAWVDQRVAAGDARPVPKQTGERVVAASIVVSGQLYVEIDQPPAPLPTVAIRETLERTASRKTWTQQFGEVNASHMAPLMLASFALTLPFLGANRAAAFLITGFGNHLRTLGPYTVQKFVAQAASEGILIKDARALEQANLVNTVIFDSRVLLEPTVRAQAKEVIHALRQRRWLMPRASSHRFAVYVMVNGGEEETARQLMAEFGIDDYFAESLMISRAAIIERLQTGGRFVCYLGQGGDDAIVMEKAFVAIAQRSLETMTTTAAQIVLLDNDLSQLGRCFDLAAAFVARQGFSLMTPIGFDLVDIGTTVFVHLGLVYSVLYNYSGLLLSAANAHLRPPPAPAPDEVPPPLPALPLFEAGATA